MPPSIDAEASPNHPPTPLVHSERGGHTTAAFSAAEIARNEVENVPNSDSTAAVHPTSLAESIEFVSREVFGTKKLRSKQSWAIELCINPSMIDSKLLLVTRTGYGKSHVMRTLGVLVGGVVIIFVPLLSLSADQMNKMKEANQKYGTVETHHLDELPDDRGKTLGRIVTRIEGLKATTTSTIFLFTSPQFLCKESSKELLSSLISARKRNVLRVVGIDEAHLMVQHSFFRVEIHMLTELFFKEIFDHDKSTHPIYLAMTATMPLQYVPKLEALTHVSLEKCRLLRPDRSHFLQLNVKMAYIVNTLTFTHALDQLVNVIKDSPTDCVVVLTTLPSTAKSLEAKLCEKLNKEKCNVDVVVVHGQLPKAEKFINMRLFCAKQNFEFFCPRALVTNGAGNTGIDSPNVRAMLRVGFPTDLQTLLQERGRCARQEQMKGSITFGCNIKSLLENLYLLNELGQSSSESGSDARSNSADGDGKGIYKQVMKRSITRMKNEKKKSLDEKNRMQLEVLKFLCQPGCYHAKSATYLSLGELTPVDGSMNCRQRCSMCDGSWQQLHRPVVKREVISWFQSFEFKEPIKTTDNPHSLTDLLWNDKNGWKEKIFGCEGDKAIKKYHVECLMLSLIAADIIIWRVANGEIEWWRNRVSEQEGNVYCYMISQYWKGIPLK